MERRKPVMSVKRSIIRGTMSSYWKALLYIPTYLYLRTREQSTQANGSSIYANLWNILGYLTPSSGSRSFFSSKRKMWKVRLLSQEIVRKIGTEAGRQNLARCRKMDGSKVAPTRVDRIRPRGKNSRASRFLSITIADVSPSSREVRQELRRAWKHGE